ncbi:Lipoate-protein ligase LplJ [Rubripirellula obstinata]|uniref:Lipoate-protein ligase LplJ n=1 Tax=Rubripirellula obstinata TaxID=406547 RepID=A0A5B1CIR5_9BACT|nr:lipoate--protein ligase family protein [Rubripirellula obstinata]KAA1261057.1 Lipoate-protein ligase LplJ [Rubripirellula obstinata]
MKWVDTDQAARSPSMQLAIDEAMLFQAEEAGSAERLRIWEFDQPTIVLGRSSKVDDEVDRQRCEANGISIQRRSSGGATVMGGPGCMMYSVLLSFQQHPGLQKIDQAHLYVMNRVLAAVQNQVPDAVHQGICDLTWQNRKFSGNSLRIARQHLLYHGTVLYDFDLDLLASCLDFAPRQPDYRQSRSHDSFVTNVELDPTVLASDLREQFLAIDAVSIDDYFDRASKLQSERYDLDSWRFRH